MSRTLKQKRSYNALQTAIAVGVQVVIRHHGGALSNAEWARLREKAYEWVDIRAVLRP